MCLYSLSWILGHDHWACFLVPTLMIPLLFWGNARTSQEYLVGGMNQATTFRQLQDIDGVLFLTGHPAGLTLGSDLKSELPTGV